MTEISEIEKVRAARKAVAEMAGMNLSRLGELLRERERFANIHGYRVVRETLQAMDGLLVPSHPK